MKNAINAGNASGFIPEVWSKDVLVATKAKQVMMSLVKRLDKDVVSFGDTVRINTISGLVANTKQQNLPVSLQTPSETQVVLTIDKHKESSFLIEDVLKVQANRALRDDYTKEAAFAITNSVETDLTGLFSGFANTTGTYNTAITVDAILDAIELLDGGNVPMEDRHFVHREDVKRDILDLSYFTSGDYVNGKPVSTGQTGNIFGLTTHMTTNVARSGSNTNNAIFHRDALGLAIQSAPRVQSDYDTQYLGWVTVVDVLYGVKELRDTFGVLVKS